MGKSGRFGMRGRGRGGRGRGRGGNDRKPDMRQFKGPGYNDAVAMSVDESVVGITRYLRTEVSGFQGTTKQRYSDFIVREVSASGDVVRLTDVKKVSSTDKKQNTKQNLGNTFKSRIFEMIENAESTPAGQAVKEAGNMAKEGREVRDIVGKLAQRLYYQQNQLKQEQKEVDLRPRIQQLKAEMAGVCDQSVANRLETFLLSLLPSNANATSSEGASFLFPEITDKDSRKRVHELLREHLGEFVVSDTITENDKTVIRVRKSSVGGQKRKDVDVRSKQQQWPSDRPDFLQFVLYKSNVETGTVMQQLAKALKLSVSSFSYAGTKDKRGITTQLCTVYRGPIERVVGMNRGDRELDQFNFLVGNAQYVPDKLNLGDLQGNRFSIAIRSLPSDDEISDESVHAAVESWKKNGYINYFGLQRFGTKSIATHEIGRALLQRNPKLAVELILKPQEGDATKIKEARQEFQDTWDIAQALKAFPPYLVAERAVLNGLSKHGDQAFQHAVQAIPRHLRMMYTHSYQSYVWNSLVSKRLEMSPDGVVPGDLVLPPNAVKEESIEDDGKDDVEDESPDAKRRKVDKTDVEPTVVTEENAADYTLYDVVLPLPGYSVKYPTNGLKEVYDRLMQEDGVDFESLEKSTSSEYHLPGSYRHLVKKPIDVSHEIKRYDDPTIPLLQTDVDVLMGKEVQPSIPGAKHRALCLEFQLSPSSYATMAVRELLKQSSNIQVQLKINEQTS